MLKPVDLRGGKSVLRSVLNIFVSQSTEKTSSIGVSFFLNFSKVQVCQCNMGKLEGNSLVGKIVIPSRVLNQIWGSAVYLDLVFLSSTGAKTSRFEWGKVSIKICVEHICVSIYGENELNWGIFFFNFSKVHVCQCNMGKFGGNSLIGKIVILSRELNPIWGSAVYLDLVFRSCTGAETSRFEWGKVSVEHICVSIYRENELNWGIFSF